MKHKKLIATVLAAAVLTGLILFFTVPVDLLRRGDVVNIFLRQGSDADRVDVKALDLLELEVHLRNTPCRRILDSTHNYFGEALAYEIGVQFEGGDSVYILLGEPDAKGMTTMMNKTYDPSKNNMLPNIRYRILDPQSLIDYLDGYLKE